MVQPTPQLPPYTHDILYFSNISTGTGIYSTYCLYCICARYLLYNISSMLSCDGILESVMGGRRLRSTSVFDISYEPKTGVFGFLPSCKFQFCGCPSHMNLMCRRLLISSFLDNLKDYLCAVVHNTVNM